MQESEQQKSNLTLLVAWDFDGVINNAVIDGKFLWAENFERDLGVPLDQFEDAVFSGGFQEVLVGQRSLLALIENWAKGVNYSGSAADILEYWFTNDTKYDSRVLSAICDIEKLGIRQVIATNTDPERTKFITRHMSEIPGVHKVYSSGTFGVAKPDERFFKEIQKREGVAPQSILFIDDSERNVDSARKLGWKSELFDGKNLKEIVRKHFSHP